MDHNSPPLRAVPEKLLGMDGEVGTLGEGLRLLSRVTIEQVLLLSEVGSESSARIWLLIYTCQGICSLGPFFQIVGISMIVVLSWHVTSPVFLLIVLINNTPCDFSLFSSIIFVIGLPVSFVGFSRTDVWFFNILYYIFVSHFIGSTLTCIIFFFLFINFWYLVFPNTSINI